MLSLDDLDDFVNGQKAKSTKSKDKSDARLFYSFCSSFGESRPIHEIPAEILNQLLCNFFVKAVKLKDGELYEPGSLRAIRNSLQRVLAENGSKMHLCKDKEIEKSREVLAARRK